MSNVLVVFYTRTENCRKIAEQISTKLNCDIDEIIDSKKWKGIFGFMVAGFNAVFERETRISYKRNPQNYDVVVIVSPIWASKAPPAIRTYINENKDKIKKHAVLLSNDGSDVKKALGNFRRIKEKPIAEYGTNKKDINTEFCQKNFEEFADKIRRVIEKETSNA